MRIVFASIGSLGDLHPILALATAARERGHVAIIAAPEVYTDYVARFGFAYRRLRPDFKTETMIEIFAHPRQGVELLMGEKIFPFVRDTYEDLRSAVQDADFLVTGELVYLAPLVAATLRLPWANAILSPSSFLSVCDPCVLAICPEIYHLRHLGPWANRLLYRFGRWKATRWSAPLAALQRELEIPSTGNPVFEGKYSPHLVLTMFPEWFSKPQPDWPAVSVQTGFPYFTQPSEAETTQKIEAFLAAGEPPIVFTLGSTAVHLARDFYQVAADTVLKLGRRAVLLIGKNTPPKAPADQVLSVSYAPLGPLFRGAAVVVHHGGIGTCGEVLQAGVPALIIPFAFDQPDNAERLRQLGLAYVLGRHHISGPALFHQLQPLLADTAMRERTREAAQRIKPAEDLTRAIEAIERIVARDSRDAP